VSQSQSILVIGGTGMLGKPVVRGLQAASYTVRVLTRRPIKAQALLGKGVEVIKGDIDDEGSLDAALRDCMGVHISLNGGFDVDLERRGAANVAQAAQRANVTRLTYLSGASVFAENCWYAGTRDRFKAEAAIRAADVPYTIFKATYFMESLPRFVHGKRALLIGKQPFSWHWLAAEDYARMVVRAYTTPEAANKSLFVYGPQALLMRDALQIFCRIAHPEVHLMPMPIWFAWIIARLGNRKELQAALPFFAYCEKVSEGGDPAEANALLGAPTIALAQWSKRQWSLNESAAST
jgi:uncharacterized protein YbjT (DUF2867 family)